MKVKATKAWAAVDTTGTISVTNILRNREALKFLVVRKGNGFRIAPVLITPIVKRKKSTTAKARKGRK